jgi:hypothetical protein
MKKTIFCGLQLGFMESETGRQWLVEFPGETASSVASVGCTTSLRRQRANGHELRTISFAEDGVATGISGVLSLNCFQLGALMTLNLDWSSWRDWMVIEIQTKHANQSEFRFGPGGPRSQCGRGMKTLS